MRSGNSLFKQKKILEGITSDLKEEIQNASKLPNMGRGVLFRTQAI